MHGCQAPPNRKSANEYLSRVRPQQPHSQVNGNRIATSSLAVDLLYKTRVHRGCFRWLRFASVEEGLPDQRPATVLPTKRYSPGSLRAISLPCERFSRGTALPSIAGCFG